MQLYSHKSFLCSVQIAKEDGYLETLSGDIPIKEGEYILQDQNGNKFPLTEDYFNEYYVPVKKVQTRTSTKLSPFEEQYINAYANYTGAELNQEEDKEYIVGMQEMSKNKAF